MLISHKSFELLVKPTKKICLIKKKNIEAETTEEVQQPCAKLHSRQGGNLHPSTGVLIDGRGVNAVPWAAGGHQGGNGWFLPTKKGSNSLFDWACVQVLNTWETCI